MTLSDLQLMATTGCHRNDDSTDPNKPESLAAIEIKNKAVELFDELNHERWDRDIIASKTAAIIFFCIRISGMYRINMEAAIKTFTNAAPSIIRKESVLTGPKKNGKWKKGRK